MGRFLRLRSFFSSFFLVTDFGTDYSTVKRKNYLGGSNTSKEEIEMTRSSIGVDVFVVWDAGALLLN